MAKLVTLSLKRINNYIDWKLLLFLILFLNVKLAVKIPAIVLIYLWRSNFRFKFNLRNSRIPLFYLLIIGIAFINLVINKNYEKNNYLIVFFMGIGSWLLCLLATHQIKLSVENNDTQAIHFTVMAFFMINAAFSFGNIACILWETGGISPYRFQGLYQKYFINTGDFIKGVTFDTSTTNSILNAFGVFYFLTRKKPVMLLICMTVLLLTGSNFINLAVVLLLLLLFLFKSTKDQKSLIIICLMFLFIFMVKVSPENNEYAGKLLEKIFYQDKPSFTTASASLRQAERISGPDSIKKEIAIRYLDSVRALRQTRNTTSVFTNIPKTSEGRIYFRKQDITLPSSQPFHDTTGQQIKLLSFISAYKSSLPASGGNNTHTSLPGKVTGLLQTASYLQHNSDKIIAGDGIGNFSSKLAYRTTGLGFYGGFPAAYIYISKEFLVNHLDTYLYFFSKQVELHSLANSPYSVYDQILSEYGLLGMSAFFIYYIWFFARHSAKLTYGLPLLLLVLILFFIDYWFEQLSVLIMFELMLFLNIKENAPLIKKTTEE